MISGPIRCCLYKRTCVAIKISELPGAEVEVIDDRGLVIGFKAGDTDAYAMIYRRYFAHARGVSLRILRNADDAEEAAQETMVRVLQALPRFNGRYDLRAWIGRIATNVSLDMLRSNTRRTRHLGFQESIDLLAPEDQLDRNGEDPSETVERMVQAHRVRAMLSDLPQTHRDALALRELHGASHQEIADQLGMTTPQVKALIHRAKGSFRRMWDAAGESRIAGALMFLVPQRFTGWIRRIADHAQDVGRSAAAVSPTVTAAASSPVIQAAASETGQKLAAAGMTILVAGGMTLGGMGLIHRRTQPSPVPPPAPLVVAAPLARVAPTHPSAPARRVTPRHHRQANAGAPAPQPSGTPTPDPSQTPPPSPGGTPPPPVVAPPPAWAGAFGIDWTSQDGCGCGSGLSADPATTAGHISDSTGVSVAQSFQGAALDAEGDAAWALSAAYDAHLQADGGNVSLTFWLGSGDARTQYAMVTSSPVIQGTAGDGKPMDYEFSGTYSLVGANGDMSPIPLQGAADLHLSVWGDGSSVYGVTFQASR